MPDHLAPSTTLLCKLASIVVHVDEALGPKGNTVDLTAASTLARDEDVVQWLDAMTKDGLAPVRR